MPETTKTTDLISINDLTPANFLNIDLFRENQEKLAKENPVIEIIDATTYKKSDASRKILKKGRTILQNSKKTDLDALKNALINPLATTYDDFIEITKNIEDQHETNCKTWEAKIAEKARIAAEEEATRKTNIQNSITEFQDTWDKKLSGLDFEKLEAVEHEFELFNKTLDLKTFQEFQMEFSVKHQAIAERLKSTVTLLSRNEEIRLENEKLNTYNARMETLLNLGAKISELGFTLPAPANEDKIISCFVSKEKLKQVEDKEWNKTLASFQKVAELIQSKQQEQKLKRTNERVSKLVNLGIEREVIYQNIGWKEFGPLGLLGCCENQTDEDFEITLTLVTSILAERNKIVETPAVVIKQPDTNVNSIEVIDPVIVSYDTIDETKPEPTLSAWEEIFFDFLKTTEGPYGIESFASFLENNYHAPLKK